MERKKDTRKKVHKWVKEERGKGRDVRVGYARVKVEGRWKNWRKIKRNLEKKKYAMF